MTHEEAWRRLPDLLDDRDDRVVLAHVRGCPDCQRQLFLLGRVDRLLRESASSRRTSSRRRTGTWMLTGAGLAAAVATLALLVSHHGRSHALVLRTASGRQVGETTLSGGDSHNASVALTARHMPVGRGQTFVLWAGDQGASIQVGRFMVDRSGACRVRFNVPETHSWRRFWVTRPDDTSIVVART